VAKQGFQGFLLKRVRNRIKTTLRLSSADGQSGPTIFSSSSRSGGRSCFTVSQRISKSAVSYSWIKRWRMPIIFGHGICGFFSRVSWVTWLAASPEAAVPEGHAAAYWTSASASTRSRMYRLRPPGVWTSTLRPPRMRESSCSMS